MLIINLAAILISIPLIRRLSHKWSRPIQTMNSEIQDIQKMGLQLKLQFLINHLKLNSLLNHLIICLLFK